MNLKKFGAGLIVNVFVKFLSVGLGFYTTRWVVQNLTSFQYEQYNLVLAYTAIILTVISFGLPSIIQKFYTNPHSKEEIAPFWTTYFLFRVFSYLIGLLIILFTFPLSQTTNLLLIIGIYTIQFILVVDILYRSITDAKGYSWVFSLTDFFNKFLLVTFLFVHPYLDLPISPLWYFVGVSGISYLIGLIVDSQVHKKQTPFGKLDFSLLRNNFRNIFYISIAFFLVGLYTTTDKIFLKYFGYSADEINGYSNAYKLFEIAMIVPGLTAPTMASMAKQRLDKGIASPLAKKIRSLINQPKKFGLNRSIVSEWIIFAMLIGLGTTLGILLFGDIALNIIDPETKYAIAFDILPILAWTMIPVSLLFFFGNLVIFKNGEKLTFIGQFIVTALAFILYITLIPRFGPTGAAWATVLTFTADMLSKTLQLKLVFDKPKKM